MRDCKKKKLFFYIIGRPIFVKSTKNIIENYFEHGMKELQT